MELFAFVSYLCKDRDSLHFSIPNKQILISSKTYFNE